MRLKPIPKFFFAALIVAATLPLSAQSNAAAHRGGWPVMVGGGISSFNIEFPGIAGYMAGPAFWADLTHIPLMPRGVGLQGEWKKIDMGAPSGYSRLESTSFVGGPTYTWNFGRFAVYGKGMAGYGSMDFPAFGSTYNHDSRTIWALGGGAQYRLWDSVWLRADYEHQWWPTLFSSSGIQPHGFTFSLAYDFRPSHRNF